MIVVPLESVVLKHPVRAPGTSSPGSFFSTRTGERVLYYPSLLMVRVVRGGHERWVPSTDVQDFAPQRDFVALLDSAAPPPAPAAEPEPPPPEAVAAAEPPPPVAKRKRGRQPRAAKLAQLEAAVSKDDARARHPIAELRALIEAQARQIAAMSSAQAAASAPLPAPTIPNVPPAALLANAKGGRNFTRDQFPPVSPPKGNGGAQ